VEELEKQKRKTNLERSQAQRYLGQVKSLKAETGRYQLKVNSLETRIQELCFQIESLTVWNLFD
jgi:hypothetical protein